MRDTLINKFVFCDKRKNCINMDFFKGPKYFNLNVNYIKCLFEGWFSCIFRSEFTHCARLNYIIEMYRVVLVSFFRHCSRGIITFCTAFSQCSNCKTR